MPSEFCLDHVRLTFQDDWVAFKMCRLDDTPMHRMLTWASDFPHLDSTWPWSQELLTEHTQALTPEELQAILHDNLHLERMADYCVTVAKLTKLVRIDSPDATLLEAFEEMGSRAEEMTSVALQSFSDRDATAAETLVDLDELIDRANRRVVQHILELAADPELREWGLRMILVSRCLERIGDHAVDIGEQTAYRVSGEFREFTDASR
jgi:phosphate uptake regulator